MIEPLFTSSDIPSMLELPNLRQPPETMFDFPEAEQLLTGTMDCDKPEDTDVQHKDLEGLMDRRCLSALMWRAMALLLYSIFISAVTIRILADQCLHGAGVIETPVLSNLLYEARTLSHNEVSGGPMYFGRPDLAHEQTWDELEKYTIFGLDAEWMDKLHRQEEGVRFPDGSYYATFAVWHQIHCLRQLHRLLYMDHYYSNGTFAEDEELQGHMTHCFHMLKEAIMCKADTALITFAWNDATEKPVADVSAPHECLNWQNLIEWIEPRRVGMDVVNNLRHPNWPKSRPEISSNIKE